MVNNVLTLLKVSTILSSKKLVETKENNFKLNLKLRNYFPDNSCFTGSMLLFSNFNTLKVLISATHSKESQLMKLLLLSKI